MKTLKIVLLMLAVNALLWAQAATPNSTPADNTAKSQCACCQKMADAKDAKSCCAKMGKDMSCCKGGKCMKDDKNAAMQCGKDGCCAKMKDGEKAMACCREGHCPMGEMKDDKDVSK
ncbi:MAG TPA: hypothetical protein VJQ82_00270 [Terriglobales bacterium]|nr:hypothetical protein [Terriglobales bacterium]